jgi:predicted transposase YbfD/YdcC
MKIPKPKHIAVDGKEDNANGFYCLRAFDCETDRVLARAKVPTKSNEITIAPCLLNMLDLKDVIVTADAMHAQRKIARVIINRSGNYIFALKGNQQQFYKDIKLYLDDIMLQSPQQANYVKYETKNRARGRTEKRICISTNNIGWLYQRKRWKGLCSLSIIKSIRVEKNKTKMTCRYFISSLSADAKNILNMTRNHWAVENRCHRQLDIDFESDHSTIRDTHAAMNLAIFKDFALSLLQNDGSNTSIRAKRERNAYQLKSLIKTLLNTGF